VGQVSRHVPSSPEDNYAVGELGGLLDIVRDQNDGARPLGQNTRQLLPHPQPSQVIQRGERLIHKQDVRVAGEGAGQFHQLPHAAGKLVGIMVFESLPPDQPKQLPDRLRARRPGEL
jgi:hypothetical protein